MSIWACVFFIHVCLFFIETGDLYEEDQILNWLMTQKDPGGDVIEDLEGQRLIDLIEQSGSMAVYFCKFIFNPILSFKWMKAKKKTNNRNHNHAVQAKLLSVSLPTKSEFIYS